MDNDATTSGGHQYVTKDFTFMPLNWGVTAANPNYLERLVRSILKIRVALIAPPRWLTSFLAQMSQTSTAVAWAARVVDAQVRAAVRGAR